MPLKLPRLNVDIADKDGKPTSVFTRFWDTFATAIEGAIASILNVSNSLNDATAQGLFTATEGTPSAGALATILLQVRTTVGDTFHAASIKLSSMAAGLSRVEITADTILLNGTLLNNGALTTDMGGANAWSLPGSVTGAGSITATVGAVWTFVTSFTDTFIGRPISIRPGVEFDNTDAADHNLQVAITVDSTDPTVGTPPYSTVGNLIVPKSPAAFIWAFPVADTPSAGSHTYRIYFKQQDGGANVRARKWSMEYQEVRR